MTTSFDPLDSAIDALPPAEAMEEPQLLKSHTTPVQTVSSHAPDALDAAIDSLPAPAEVDAAQTQMDEARRGELLRWAVRASDRSPEEQAEVFRLSIALGETPDMVAGDLPWARKEVDARKLDAASVIKAHPALEEFFGNPETATLARGDTERLTGLARLIGGELEGHKVPGVFERLIEGRSRAQELLALKRQHMDGTTTDAAPAPWEDHPVQSGPVGIPGVTPLREQEGQHPRPMTEAEKKTLVATITQKEEEYRRFRAHGDGVEDLGLVGRMTGRLARTLTDIGPEMLESAALAAVSGPAAPATVTAFWAREMAPDIFWQLSQLKDSAGQPILTEGEARGYALASSIPLGALNAISMESVGATFKGYAASKPFVSRAVAAILPDATAKLTSTPGFAMAVARSIARYGAHEASVGVTMGLQSGVQAATIEAAKAEHGQGFSASAVQRAFVSGAVQGMEDFALLSGFRPAMQLLGERGKVQASIESARVLRDIAENTRESKLAQRSPEKFAELAQKLGPDAKVHVDIQGLVDLSQKENTTPRKLAAALMGDEGKAFDRLTETGGRDLSVPLASYAEKAVKSGLHEKLARDVRTSLDEFTPRQLSEHVAETQKAMEQRAAARGPGFEAEAKALESKIAKVATEAGYAKREAQAAAKTLSKFAATMSLRMDVSLHDALVRAGFPQLRLEGRELLPGLMREMKVTPEERVATGTTEHAPAAAAEPRDVVADLGNGQAAKTIEAARKGDRRAQARLEEAAYVEPLTKLLNRTAFEDYKANRSAGTWDVAIDANDLGAQDLFGGHDSGDRVLTTVADAMRAASDGKARLFRWGGDEFHAGGFGSKEEAQAFAQAVHEKLKASPDVAEGYRASVSMGVGPDVKTADRATYVAKKAKKEKHGSFNKDNPEAFRPKGAHGESFIHTIEHAAPKGEEPVTTLDGGGVITAKLAQGDRGVIKMRPDGKGEPVEFDIRALGGDKSTLAHESAHFLSWSLHKLATAEGADEGIARDYKTLLDFGGWKDAEERLADNRERLDLQQKAKLTEAETRRLDKLNVREEKLASAWEQYLADGIAPSRDMRPVFARYAKWMAETYKGLAGPAEHFRAAYGEDLNISEDVRGVFDRMLAIDGEVSRLRAEDAKMRLDLTPLTPKEQEQLTALREAKYAEAQDRLTRAVMRDGARGSTGTLRDVRDQMRAEVKAEVDRVQVYVAHDFLKTGELRDGDTGHVFAPGKLPEAYVGSDGKPLKLMYADAVRLLGEKEAKTLRARGLTEKEGVKADVLAGPLGYDDGAALLRALHEATPRERLVEQETAARFEDTFGPELAKHESLLRAEGNDALHNPADIAETVTLRNVVAREVGGQPRLATEVLHKQAESVVSKMTLEDLSPRRHLEAERRGLKQAFTLMERAKKALDAGKGEEADALHSEALHELDGVLLNKALYRAADAALKRKERIERVIERAGKEDWRATLGKADPAYRDASDAIVGAIGQGDEKLARPDAIDGALQALQRDGATSSGVALDEDGRLNSAFWDSERVRGILADKTPWEKLTVSEAEAVHDALVQMRVVASDKGKLGVAGKRVARADMISALRESAARIGNSGEAFSWKGLKAHEKVGFGARLLVHGVDSVLTDIETLVDRLVANDRNHPAWEFLVGERARARTAEIDMGEKFVRAMHDRWNDLPKEMRRRAGKTAEGAMEELGGLPETGGIFNRERSRLTYENLWTIALNLGNAGNKQRLLDGFGWSEGAVRDVLAKHLTEADWRWVEGVWGALSDLYPALAATHEKATGLRLPKVEAEKFTVETADGKEIEVSGGYFPAKLDKRAVSKRGLADQQDAAYDALVGTLRRPSTRSSASHTRSEKNTDMLDLDFGLIPSHVAQVVHDATHRLYVRDLATVVMDKDFQSVVRGSMGIMYEKQFRSWAQEVAGGGSKGAVLGLEPVQKFLSRGKSIATLASVGFNIGVPLADLTNPLLPVVAGDLSVTALMRTLNQAPTGWKDMRALALEKSGVMRERARTGNSLGAEVGHALGSRGYAGKVEHAAYWMMEQSDKMTSTVVWAAKFAEGLEKHSDEALAIRDADATVRRYFPSNDQSAKPAILRDRNGLGYFTFLYGFGSKLYQMDRRVLTNMIDAWHDGDATALTKAQAVGKAIGVLGMQLMLTQVAGEYLSGRGKKDEDSWGKYAKDSALAYAAYQIPVNAFLGGGRGALPIPSTIGKAHKAISTGLEHLMDGKVDAEMVGALGALAVQGPGLNQFTKTGRYLDQGFSRDLRQGDYARIASGVVFGEKKNGTPITDVRDNPLTRYLLGETK